MIVKLLHSVVDGIIGVPGVSESLYRLLGHGRWHDLVHSLVQASAESGAGSAGGAVDG